MEDNNEKMVNGEEMTTEIVENFAKTDTELSENQEETANVENGDKSASEDVQKEEKPKLTFDQKVDKTANFIKKYKIALLCGIIAVLALVIGIIVGSAFGKNDDSDEVSSYQSSVSTTSPQATVAATVAPTEEPSTGSDSTVTESSEAESVQATEEVVLVTYADLLDNKIYFSESSDISLVEAEVIQLLNNVLLASDEVVTADGVEAESKVEMADSVNVSVTKDEMKALLDDLGATFTNIDQSVSGDILTLDVDMAISIPDDVLAEIKSNSDSIATTIALAAVGTNLSFSYQVSYEMDGESLIPIEIVTSTIDINNLGTTITKLIAGVALSSYSSADVDTATLLAGYNNMAGEIIADVLNNYGIVTGASEAQINITTRTND